MHTAAMSAVRAHIPYDDSEGLPAALTSFTEAANRPPRLPRSRRGRRTGPASKAEEIDVKCVEAEVETETTNPSDLTSEPTTGTLSDPTSETLSIDSAPPTAKVLPRKSAFKRMPMKLTNRTQEIKQKPPPVSQVHLQITSGITGESICCVSLESSKTVMELKEDICALTNMPIQEQRLLLDAVVLEDASRLNSIFASRTGETYELTMVRAGSLLNGLLATFMERAGEQDADESCDWDCNKEASIKDVLSNLSPVPFGGRLGHEASPKLLGQALW